MNYIVIELQRYLVGEEFTLGIATISILMLASAVMAKCLIAYPAIAVELAIIG